LFADSSIEKVLHIKKACTSPRADPFRNAMSVMDWEEVHELDETGRKAPMKDKSFTDLGLEDHS
jgi:hypothetical protein